MQPNGVHFDACTLDTAFDRSTMDDVVISEVVDAVISNCHQELQDDERHQDRVKAWQVLHEEWKARHPDDSTDGEPSPFPIP
jgi:hypothetical protein